MKYEDKKGLIQEKHYRHQAKYFDSEFSQKKEYRLLSWHKSYIKKITKHLLRKTYKNRVLLDIGAGDAYVTIEMAKLGLRVLALDLSKASLGNIESHKKRFGLRNIKTIHANAEKIPLKDKTVDYIVANAILEHLPKESKAISEWKRVLKPGGRMMVTVPLKFKYVWPFFWPINFIHDKSIGHLRRYDLEELKRKFDLKVINHFYTGHLIKAIWVIYSVITKSNILDELIESIDYRKRDDRYGASNLIVIFEKRSIQKKKHFSKKVKRKSSVSSL